MALGLLANLNSIEVRKPTVSPASIMTATFAKTVESRAGTPIDERQPSNAGTSRAQMRPYLVAERNALRALSMANTAHEALAELANVLDRMRSLVVAGAEMVLAPDDIHSMQEEYGKLRATVDRVRNESNYDGSELLGPNAQPVVFDLGASGGGGEPFQLKLAHFSWDAPHVSIIGSRDPETTEQALVSIDSAIATTKAQRAEILSSLKRIETAAHSIQTRRLNTASAQSRARDVAVAEEMARLSSDLVMRQPGVSILGQSEQLTHLSLGLLR